MNKLSLILFIIFFSFSATAKNIPDIVAIVDKEPITFKRLEERKKLLLFLNKDKINKNVPNFEPIFTQNVLNSLIDEVLLSAYAKKIKLNIDEGSISRAIENLEAGNNFQKGYYEKSLKTQSIDYSSFRDQVRYELIKNEIFGNFYRSSKIASDEVDEILLFTGSKDASIQGILFTSKRLSDGFLLRMESLRPKVKNCKRISPVLYRSFAKKEEVSSKLSELNPQLRTVFKDLRINEPSGIFKSGDHYRFALLCDKRVDPVTSQENDYLTNLLTNKKVSIKAGKFLRNLRSRAYVRTYLN